jgi:hypothetical protein
MTAALTDSRLQLSDDLRRELGGAIMESRLELTAALRKEIGGVRSEISGLRKAVEIIAVKLLTGPEVQEVRRAAAG